MKYSAFCYGHNLIDGGYPIREAVSAVQNFVDEIVFVDCQSTDYTRSLLVGLGCKVVDGEWGLRADGVMEKAHWLGQESCTHENIIHFEADEVWEERLIRNVVQNEMTDCLVWRVQVEQNFQRIRWNPHQVHRVFRKGKAHKDPKRGHTTKEHDRARQMMRFESGLIYDCSYVFRDHWKRRAEQNARLWGEDVDYTRRVPEHFMEGSKTKDVNAFLNEPQWLWKTSPLHIPAVLRPLIGVTKYE